MENRRHQGNDKPPEVPDLAEVTALVRVVLWAVLIALGGWLSFPFLGIPVSLQTFFVVLAGLLEGPKLGASAAGLYLLAGLLGLPVFAGGLGGPAILFGPTAGFALAFPLGALVAGLAVTTRRPGERLSFARAYLLALTGGVLVVYSCGFLGLLVNTAMAPKAAALILLSVLPFDFIKLAAAALLATRRHRRG